MKDAIKLANWIMDNRRGMAFRDYDMATVCKEILECLENDTMLMVEDEKQNIVGVFFGTKNEATKNFFVYDVLVTEPWVLKEMLIYFNNKFPGYSISGTKKNGIKRHFNNAQQILERI